MTAPMTPSSARRGNSVPGTVVLDDARIKELDALAAQADERADDAMERFAKTVAERAGVARTTARRELLIPILAALGREFGDDRNILSPFEQDVRKADAGATDELVTKHLEAIKHAQRFFDDNGVAVLAALFHASLPEAYLGRRGVQVLDATGELSLNWSRRIQETGQFLVNVLSPTPDLWRDDRSSLHTGEFGARMALRVRLTHAAIRWMLREQLTAAARGSADGRDLPLDSLLLSKLQGTTVWQQRLITAGLENEMHLPPLNQQDLTGTVGTFTTVVFRALERLGVPYADDQREAFHILWHVVARHLGVVDVPIGVTEMDATYDHLARKLQGPSAAGQRMAKALMQELAYPLPRPMQGAPAFITRYVIGADHANGLEIEEGGYLELLLTQTGALGQLAKWAQAGPLRRVSVGQLSRTVTQYALRAFIAQARWSERGLTVDPRIAAKWGIQLPPQPRVRGARPGRGAPARSEAVKRRGRRPLHAAMRARPARSVTLLRPRASSTNLLFSRSRSTRLTVARVVAVNMASSSWLRRIHPSPSSAIPSSSSFSSCRWTRFQAGVKSSSMT